MKASRAVMDSGGSEVFPAAGSFDLMIFDARDLSHEHVSNVYPLVNIQKAIENHHL